MGVGPGALISVNSDFIGPFPIDSFWTVSVLGGPTFERVLWRNQYPCVGNQLRRYLGEPGLNNPAEQNVGIDQRGLQGDAVHFVVRLETPSTGFSDQNSFNTGVYDEHGTENRLPQQLASAIAGFTETDRQELAITKASVQVPFPILTAAGGFVLRGLADLVTTAPLSILARADCQDLSGTGVLTRPFPGFTVAASGLTWDFVDIPTFFGRKDGTLLEFTQRIVQFQLVARDRTGAERTFQVIDAFSDNQIVTWGLTQLERVEYSVTPGCAVRFCWLVVG